MPIDKTKLDKVLAAYKLQLEKGLQPLTPEELKQLEARRAAQTPQAPLKPRGS